MKPEVSHALPHDAALQIVVVEDSPDYGALVQAMLLEHWPGAFNIHAFDRIELATGWLAENTAGCVLLDLSLPDADGLDGVNRIQHVAGDVPIVVLSGNDDEQLALEAVKGGVQDYLLKRSVDGPLLARAVRYAIERRRAELELSHLALHDALTGLPNRVLFEDRLELAFARAARAQDGGRVAVLFLDLDRFKLVNDSLGHAAGDEMLVEVSNRIAGVMRPTDTVARFGGDEFAVLCEQIGHPRELIAVAERIRAAVAAPMQVRRREMFVTASIGIALAEQPNPHAETVLRNADTAMYRAKDHGGIEMFDRRLQAAIAERLKLEHDLHRALRDGQLRLHYQPLISVDGGRMRGVEALVRWQHPEHGLLQPIEFIPLAEETGLIDQLGDWVMNEACQQLARWQSDGRAIEVSVNVSPRQLRPALADRVAGVIDSTGVHPPRLCLEITESQAVGDDAETMLTIERLKGLGVKIAIDDFGSGYSTLTYLNRLPLDQLKIDRSFVTGVDLDPHKLQVLSALIALAEALGVTAVAEGVEEEGDLTRLRAMGCDAAQGFCLGRPVPPGEIDALLNNGA
ncbi:MAG: EAL domain-containing protein [Thermoleophilaceae bacterium]|nr:EAL domain-containing protein [Thermoleophilaceae bacterium]